MNALLWLNPGRWLAAGAGLAIVVGLLYALHWQAVQRAVDGVHATYRERDAREQQEAVTDAAWRRMRNQEAERAKQIQVARARADADRLRAEYDGLQHDLAEYRAAAEAAGGTDTGRVDGATTAEELFGECSRRHFEMAREATPVQSRLRELQDWVTANCAEPEQVK